MGCDKGDDRKHCKERKAIDEASGGDWFHKLCLGIRPKAKISNMKNFQCHKCDPLSQLKKSLSNENRYIVEIGMDGNCMYRALALDKFGDQERHEEIRNILCMKMTEMFTNERYKQSWNNKFLIDDHYIRDPEKKLVRYLAIYMNSIFNEGLKNKEQLNLKQR